MGNGYSVSAIEHKFFSGDGYIISYVYILNACLSNTYSSYSLI